MITVKQLITRLSDYPPDMPVVVGGFDESGYDPLGSLEIIPVIDRGGSAHSGRFGDAEMLEITAKIEVPKEATKMLLLTRAD